MTTGYFITGTDTGVGKTWATLSLIHYFKNQGKSAAGMKPVASGCLIYQGKLVNEDALQIQQHSSINVDYDLINPYGFAIPVSPHIAGVKNPVIIDKVLTCYNELKNSAEVIIVEGAGGWYTPINGQQDMADLAKALRLPVILVVAIRLGCINHAKLTFRAIQQTGIECAGWIATCSDPEVLSLDETIETIKNAVETPLLGVLPYTKTADFNFFSQQLRL
jgi:dethiobiotin synthetase